MTDFSDPSNAPSPDNNGDLQALLTSSLHNEKDHVLQKYADNNKNLVDEIKKIKLDNGSDILLDMASRVIYGFTEDQQSQAKWMQDADDIIRLSKLTREPKNTPLPQSANIKYPLIVDACYQFAARMYPELIQDGRIVKTEIFGDTTPIIDLIAKGLADHMNYQILGPDSEWEASMDRLLNVLPNLGFVVKKTYRDELKNKNVSDICNYKDIILRNDSTVQCLNDLRRITHIIHIHPNDLIEGCRAGIYDEYCIEDILKYYSAKQLNPECTLYEQHTFWDLDQDGYEEPYIITVHKQTNKVIRVIARYTRDDIKFNSKDEVLHITPIQYFTDYHLLPAPDGSFMSVGFGSLLLHLNETINTILNQLIDAGTLANLQTGVIDSRIKLMGGQMEVSPGQWIRAKGVIGQSLKEGIFPITYKEPSPTLFQLLGLLVQAAKDLISSTDAVEGSQNGTNVPATTMLAQIEQGLKLYSAIQRRIYRSLKEEYQKIYRLNSLYLDEKEYLQILGPVYKQLPNIYKVNSIKVIPIADPNLSSDAQRLTQAQVMMSLAGRPGVNNAEIYKRFLQAARVQNVEAIISPQAAQQANMPDPKMLDMHAKNQIKQSEVQIKGRAQDLKEKEFAANLSKLEAEIDDLRANSYKLVHQGNKEAAQAQSVGYNDQLSGIQAKLDAMHQAHSQMIQSKQVVQQGNLQQQKQMQEHHVAMIQANQDQQDLDQTHQRETQGLQNDQDQIAQQGQQDSTDQNQQSDTNQ